MTRARWIHTHCLTVALCAGAVLAPRVVHAANPLDATLPSSPAEAAAPPPSRDFAISDLLRAQRLAIAALQDLGFALESADADRGVITASRLDTHPLRLTVTLSAAHEATVTASVVTDFAGAPISDPRPAEAFFAAFQRNLSPPPPID